MKVVFCLHFDLYNNIDLTIATVGVFIRDLTFFNDGNQKALRNGLLNFSKLRTMVLKVRIKLWPAFEVVQNELVYCACTISEYDDKLETSSAHPNSWTVLDAGTGYVKKS